MTVPDKLLDALARYEGFLVLGHVEPDGDCIASQLLMRSILRRLGKKPVLCNVGPFVRPEIMRYAAEFSATVRPEDRAGNTLVLILDCSTLERTGSLAEQVRGLPAAVIDHHSSGSGFGEVRFVDSSSPSVTFMLSRLMERLNLEPSREDAELILFGLCTDTAFFRHLDERSSEVFTVVSRLVRRGASPKGTFDRIYGGRDLEERRLLGAMLARAESHFGGRLLFCHQTEEEHRRPGAGQGGSDELYRLLQTVAGVELVVLIRHESGTEHSVGLRSSGALDVGSVARKLGGGGHAPAAGCTLFGSFEEIKRRVLDELSLLLAH